MAIDPISIAATVRSALVANKLKQVQEGSKNFTPPKNAMGKLIGNLTGRTQAASLQESMKKESISNSAVQSGIPVSGGFQFGGQATRNTWLPFAVVAAVALFIFSPFKKRRRR